MKKYRLYDQISAMLISEFDDKEEGVMEVGAIMSHLGVQHAMGRYVLTQKPDRIGNAKIVYHPHELMSRAFVYVDQKHLQSRMNKLNPTSRFS